MSPSCIRIKPRRIPFHHLHLPSRPHSHCSIPLATPFAMTHSVLSSFDPLATHPFTNNSGLLPKPAAPSKYPLPIPTSRTSAQTSSSSTPIHAPQPSRSPPTSRSTKSNAGTRGPIFVPFRPERSSPDLEDILLKKKVSDVLTNKQSWSIDQTNVSSPSSSPPKRA